MISSNGTVSIITTIYNCSSFLRESIESILNQSFREFEFIIINDGSTDDCENIVKSYSDRRIRYIPNKDNKKIPTRRNEAIKMAKGDFIAIHDGDDISLPDRIGMQAYYLRNNIDYFCVGGHAVKIDSEGKTAGKMHYPPEKHEDIVNMLVRKCMNPIIDPTTMFRRKDFLEVGQYTLEKDIYTVPDFDLWCRAVIAGKKFLNLQMPLINYRVNPNGMTGKHREDMVKQHMIVWHRFIKIYYKLANKAGNNELERNRR